MPETYSAHESRVYYVEETEYGQTPANPSMLSVPAESLEPAVNPNNIKLRGVGSIDLQAIKKGLRAFPSLYFQIPNLGAHHILREVYARASYLFSNL